MTQIVLAGDMAPSGKGMVTADLETSVFDKSFSKRRQIMQNNHAREEK